MAPAEENARPRTAPALILALCFAVGAVAMIWIGPGGGRGPDRVVLVVVDTLRSDHLPMFGADVSLPTLEALAGRGRHYELRAAFHQTTGSMGSLFTGRTPALDAGEGRRAISWNGATWCGLARFAEEEDESCVPKSLPTLGERLQREGYWTIGVTSNQLLFEPSGFSRGFDDWNEVGRTPEGVARNSRAARKARSWPIVNRGVERALARRKRERMFLYVHYMDVHDYGSDPAVYAQRVVDVDLAIGELLAILEREGLADDALVIVTSDHGERFAETHALRGRVRHYGNPSFEEVLRVPFVVAPAPSKAVAANPPERTQDILPFVLQLTGAAWEGAPELRRGEHYVGERHFQTYVDGAFKTAVRRSDGGSVLFDLGADPGETRDASRDHPDVAEAHLARVEELSKELAARKGASQRALSTIDRERLEALGYVE